MICTMASGEGKIRIDTDKVAGRYLEGRPLYVQPLNEEERASAVAFLTENGFAWETEEGILESRFPLIVSLKDRTVSVMGNGTCAAAAAGSGIVIGIRELCLLYSLDAAAGNRSPASRTEQRSKGGE